MLNAMPMAVTVICFALSLLSVASCSLLLASAAQRGPMTNKGMHIARDTAGLCVFLLWSIFLGLAIGDLTFDPVTTLVLRYALDLSVKEIAHLTGDRPDKVKATLEIGKQRAIKGSKSPKGALNALHIACREVLETACYPPDFSAVMRSIERIIEDKNVRNERSFSVKPMLSWLITGILMVFTALIIWMTVVLIDYFRAPVKAVNPVFPTYTQTPENTEG